MARILKSALERARSGNQALVSESELVQVARITLVGSNNVVHVSSGADARTPSSEDAARALVSECFRLVAQQPGLSVEVAVGPEGERRIRIVNLEQFVVPPLEDLEVAAKGVLAPPRAADDVLHGRAKQIETAPPSRRQTAEQSLAGPDVAHAPSSSKREQRTSAAEYAAEARRAMSEPDPDPDA